MELSNLKDNILTNNLDNINYIFICEDNYFLAETYINRIAELKFNNNITYIQDIEELAGFTASTTLYVLKTEVFESEYVPNTNLIVCCKKCSLDEDKRAVKFSKPTDWQVEDYIATKLPGLDSSQQKALKVSCKDLYRLEAEIEKLDQFSKQEQQEVFNKLDDSNGFKDLSSFSLFDFNNAFLKKDLRALSDLCCSELNIDSVALLNLIIKQFKYILDIQLNPQTTSEALNITPNQFRALKGCCNYYTNEQIVEIYKKLLKVPGLIRLGIIQTNQIKDYLVSLVMEVV